MATTRPPARPAAWRLSILCLVIAATGLAYADSPGAAAGDATALPAEPIPPAPTSMIAADSGAWEPLPPPETPLIAVPANGEPRSFARALAAAGSGGGMAITAFGLYTIAASIGDGSGSAAAHGGIAIAVSGSLIAAISSALLSILADAVSPVLAE